MVSLANPLAAFSPSLWLMTEYGLGEYGRDLVPDLLSRIIASKPTPISLAYWLLPGDHMAAKQAQITLHAQQPPLRPWFYIKSTSCLIRLH